MHTAPMQSKVWQALPAWWPSTPEKDINDYFGSKACSCASSAYIRHVYIGAASALKHCNSNVPAALLQLCCGQQPFFERGKAVALDWHGNGASMEFYDGRRVKQSWGALQKVRAEFRGGMRISPVTGRSVHGCTSPWSYKIMIFCECADKAHILLKAQQYV
eukprot:4821225-Amphidinium_carterae.1